jgi:hypothetical protein
MAAAERMVQCVRADGGDWLFFCHRDYFSSSTEVDARCFVIRNFVQIARNAARGNAGYDGRKLTVKSEEVVREFMLQ